MPNNLTATGPEAEVVADTIVDWIKDKLEETGQLPHRCELEWSDSIALDSNRDWVKKTEDSSSLPKQQEGCQGSLTPSRDSFHYCRTNVWDYIGSIKRKTYPGVRNLVFLDQMGDN